MRRDESLLTEFLPQLPFNSPRSLVGLLQGGVAVHAEVDINGPGVSDAARAQTVGQRSALRFVDDIDDELLFVFWQGFLKQFLYARHKEFKRHPSDEEADDDGRYGVEDAPRRAEENGAADTDSGADARERITAMVPGVGHHHGGVDATTDTRSPLKEKFLGNHGD